MERYAEIEISLYSLVDSEEPPGLPISGTRDYIIEITFTDPEDPYREPGIRSSLTIDYDNLANLDDSPKAYGVALMSQLNQKSVVKDYLEPKRHAIELRDQEKNTSTGLRIILDIDQKSPELHGIHWEALRDYRDDSWMLSSESTLFSRYIQTRRNGRPSLRPRGELSAAVVVANPSDLDGNTWKSGGLASEPLHPIDVPGELARAKAALTPVIPEARVHEFFRDDQAPASQPVSLDRLVEAISEGNDILYLACHGSLITQGDKRGPYVLLEKKTDGTGEIIPGTQVLERLTGLSPNKRPRLVLLASCESSNTGETSDASSALQGIGARLAELGIPAVIAMQGKISMQTVADFMPAFFKALLAHGQIDLALATARSAVMNQPDAYMPVLYLGLKNGNLWYVPSVVSGSESQAGSESEQAERLKRIWVTLKSKYPKQLTPVIGPGISERLLGGRRQFSTEWAEELKYPLDEYDREQLERVALFLAVDIDPDTAKANYLEEQRKHLLKLHSDKLDTQDPTLGVLEKVIEQVGKAVWQAEPEETYMKLASLDFPLYITACQDTFLEEALRFQGKTPKPFICQWRQGETAQDLTNVDLTNEKEPVIFYLFGNIENSDSLVLTLDDLFEYLIFVPQEKRIPEPIWIALTSKTSLFLGFEVTDLSFRTLFRSIEFHESSHLFLLRPHVAVQVNPQGERLRDQGRARKFLQRSFTQVSGKISVFWMRAEDFIAEFYNQVSGGGG